MRKFFRTILLITLLFPLAIIPYQVVKGNNDIVYYVPLENEVEQGLSHFLERAIKTAEKDGAKAIIFEIHTPGGRVDSADDIAKLLNGTELKTIGFINQNAYSAGAYISLYMDEIYMVPSGKMGSAAVITQDGNAADQKAQSAWLASMKAAAESGGKDPVYAMAMADDSIDLPKYGAPKGKLLTLTASQAVEVGYANGIVNNREELLKTLQFENAEIRDLETTFAEDLARFLTNPIVVPILLSIGSLGLVLELYSPGFGIPGYMGIVSLLLYFYGHYIAGFAGYESVILLVLGIILLILELFIPGGIAGFLGLGAIVFSILLAGENVIHTGISLLVAITIAIFAMVILMKIFGKKMRLLNKIVLRDATTTEEGYVSNRTRTDLLGKVATTITPLRPSGTIQIDDERVDAVSEGNFINVNKKVKVVKVEGVRIVVREMNEEND
ncbi:NfeD family protein [Bacillus kwashiorkori]|uniref:NfeD family protein n=1 Tax=Bacillus kwashiorkori TaxID=1522318 RepID=UPI00078054D2|nr:nodulation protein NfeD [Bacillus kwashiorkori]